MVDMLASAVELAGFIDSDVDTYSAEQAIQLSTALLQAHSRQRLVRVVDDVYQPAEDVLAGFRRRHYFMPAINAGTQDDYGWYADLVVPLPQRPVISVSAVTGLSPGAWRVAGNDLLFPPWATWQNPMTITYTHGYDTTAPQYVALKALCLQVASRMFTNPTSIESESMGAYSVTYGARRTGAVTLTDEEKDSLSRIVGSAKTASLALG